MMNRTFKILLIHILLFVPVAWGKNLEPEVPGKQSTDNYADLVNLFNDWRAFEIPPLLDGAPDYTAATFEQRMPRFKELSKRLQEIDTTGWKNEENNMDSILSTDPGADCLWTSRHG